MKSRYVTIAKWFEVNHRFPSLPAQMPIKNLWNISSVKVLSVSSVNTTECHRNIIYTLPHSCFHVFSSLVTQGITQCWLILGLGCRNTFLEWHISWATLAPEAAQLLGNVIPFSQQKISILQKHCFLLKNNFDSYVPKSLTSQLNLKENEVYNKAKLI